MAPASPCSSPPKRASSSMAKTQRCSMATADLMSPLTPAFSVGNLVWMEMGGVYVQANLRGGGEYGEPWHLAGTKLQKQNVFDDFIAAAEWLIANHYTATRSWPSGTQQRRLAGGRLPGAASRSFRRGPAGRRRDGYAALPQIHHRLGVDLGLRIVGRRRASSRRFTSIRPCTI